MAKEKKIRGIENVTGEVVTAEDILYDKILEKTIGINTDELHAFHRQGYKSLVKALVIAGVLISFGLGLNHYFKSKQLIKPTKLAAVYDAQTYQGKSIEQNVYKN